MGRGDKNACGELGDGGVVVWDTALLRGNLGWGERARDFQFFKSLLLTQVSFNFNTV